MKNLKKESEALGPLTSFPQLQPTALEDHKLREDTFQYLALLWPLLLNSKIYNQINH